MSAMSIINSIKVCGYMEGYGLDRQVMQLPWGTVLSIMECESNRQCIKSLVELQSDAQKVLLSNADAMGLYSKLYNFDVDIKRSSLLFCDEEFVHNLGNYTVEEVGSALNNSDIPEEFIYMALKHPDIMKREDYQNFWTGCRLIMEQSELSGEWCYEHYKLTASEVIRKTGLLCNLADYESAVRAIAADECLYECLVILQHKRSVCISQAVFEQIKDDSHSLLRNLKQVLDKIPKGKISDFVWQLIQNARLVQDLNAVKRKWGSAGSWDFLNSRLEYVAFCCSEVLDFEVLEYQEDLVLYAMQNKKKAFIRLIRQNNELFQTIKTKSVLYYPEFYKECININTLNKADLTSLAGMTVSKSKVERLAYNNLTFKEFKVLYASRDEVIGLYYNLDIKSVDRKLEIIREFIGNVTYLAEESIKRLPEYLRVKKLSDWRNEDFGHIKRINYNTVVELLTYYEDLQKFVKDIKDRDEALRICKNIEVYKDMQSIMDIRESVVGTDKDWLYLKSKFQLTNEFVNLNRDSIAEFIIRNGAYIAHRYLCQQMQFLYDLKKLVIAELTGRFDEVKYPEDGLTRELGVTVDEKTYQIWKKNTEAYAGDLRAWEEDSLIPVMQIGEVPTVTCLSYEDGSYSECLLSNFDTNKKVLFVSEGDHIILRAIIRFTKGSWDVQDERDIAFVDVTQQRSRGSFVIFLEKAYCTVSDATEKHRCFDLMFSMLREKAEKMNVVLVCSNEYQMWQDFMMQVNYNLYISASKVGHQYLDSFHSMAELSDESRYYEAAILVHKEDIQSLQ